MDDAQIRIVKALRNGIQIVEEPFAEVAKEAGVTEDELLAQLRSWKADGTIRRFGAILRHQRAGFDVNAMTVWNVPDDQVDTFGQMAAEFQAVSHCYERPKFDDFPYNLYTMIHGKSRGECELTAKEISAKSGITQYEMLYTTTEFKKTGPIYFG